MSPAQRNAYLAERNAALDQQSRRADLMAGYRPGDGDPLLHQLSRAEELVAQCEKDMDRAHEAMRYARADFPGDVELAAGRYLDPDLRERYDAFVTAEGGVARAMAALQDAKRLESALLADYEDTYRATALGRTPDVV